MLGFRGVSSLGYQDVVMFCGSEVISKMGVWSSLTWTSLEPKHSKTLLTKLVFALTHLHKNYLAFVEGLNSQARVLNTCSCQVDCTWGSAVSSEDWRKGKGYTSFPNPVCTGFPTEKKLEMVVHICN